MHSLSRAECRELDRAASASFGIPSLLLMEHASLGAALLAAKLLGGRTQDARVWVVCGPGNNGGDGYAAARHLSAAGARVITWSLSNPWGLPAGSDARINYEILAKLALRHTLADGDLASHRAPDAELVIDAIFGTGLTRPPAGHYAAAIELMQSAGIPILSLDIPSGLDCDLGTPLGACVRARWTASFAAPKRGFSAPGADRFTGEVFVIPIGLPPQMLPAGAPAFPPGAYALNSPPDKQGISQERARGHLRETDD